MTSISPELGPDNANPIHRDPSLAATGLVGLFHNSGVFEWADVLVAQRLCDIAGESRETVRLAVAFAVWAVRTGSVCVDLSTISAQVFEVDESRADTTTLPWPHTREWVDAVLTSPVVGCEPDGPQRPLRLLGTRLYLDRYWREEERVRVLLQDRIGQAPPEVDPMLLQQELSHLFPDSLGIDQRRACQTAASSWVTVISGGPGTGKTTAIGRLVTLMARLGCSRIALAAPTGKAAIRLGEAVRSEQQRLGISPDLFAPQPVTVHRLLGLRPGARIIDVPQRSLPFDVIVVDEMSMVSLPLMARLLSAVAPRTRLVLVGDPDQLASVETGAVLSDLTDSAARSKLPVVSLQQNFRFGTEIASFADAVRTGDHKLVREILHSDMEAVRFVSVTTDDEPDELVSRVRDVGQRLWSAAIEADIDTALTCLSEHRILCGHRRGPFGVTSWNRRARLWLVESIDGYPSTGEWFVGRPVLVTTNDAEIGVYNGDTGVVVRQGSGQCIAFDGGRLLPTHAVEDVLTAHAMTVHKAQGSQFEHVSFVVPPPGSPLLTRELLYTAITRSRRSISCYGTEDAIMEAVRRPALRASGLASRL